MSRLTRFVRAAVLSALALTITPGALASTTAAAPAVVTSGRIDALAGPLEYETSVSEIIIPGDSGEPAGAVSAIAYTRTGPGAADARPVTFFFNGGPGSSSVWLHMGLAGPRRIDIERDQPALIDNEHTILDVTDAVFIDPVGTGFSRVLGDAEESEFWTVDADARSVVTFIDRFLDERDRRDCPVFIAGESYGAIRAAAMLEHLEALADPVQLEGIILISPAMDTNLVAGNGGIARAVMHLPSYAAVAFDYGLTADRYDTLAEAVTDATVFARTDYKEALLEWDQLGAQERRDIVDRVGEITGVRRSTIARDDGMLDRRSFLRELRRATGVRVDTMDASRPARPGGPSLRSVFGRALKHYLDTEIGRLDDRGYLLFNSSANRNWRGPDLSRHLFGQRLEIMPLLEAAGAAPDNDDEDAPRFFVAGGVYDLVTPFGEAPYLFERSIIDPDRVTIEAYEGGHMMYLRQASLERLANHLRAFIAPMRAP